MQAVNNQTRSLSSAFTDALSLAFFESLVVWGIGFVWYWVTAFAGYSQWSALPLFVFGGLLLVQLLIGSTYWAIGNYYLHDPAHLSPYRWQPQRSSVLNQSDTETKSAISHDRWQQLGQKRRHRGQVLVYSVMITMTVPPLLALFGIAITILRG